jgi:hypothetical protein
MKSQAWENSVRIEVGGKTQSFVRISTTRDAASYLVDRWPGQRDEAYRAAVVTCTNALTGKVNDELVLRSFVRAASVSGLKYISISGRSPDEFELEIMRAARQSVANELGELPNESIGMGTSGMTSGKAEVLLIERCV